MSDDVDDRVRDAMASLGRQVPAGYFDTLAERTLARLDDAAPEDFVDEEIVTEDAVIGERDEHSGLQDIRNLASETKARLARRTSQQAIAREDRIASSSAGWKAMALPDPARRVPEAAAEKGAAHEDAAAQAQGAALGGSSALSSGPIDELARARAAREVSPAVGAVGVAGVGAAGVGTSNAAVGTALVARRGGGSQRRLVAIAGLAVAAAAGGVLVVSSRSADEARAPRPVAADNAALPHSAAARAPDPAPPVSTPTAAAPAPPAPTSAVSQGVIATGPKAVHPEPAAGSAAHVVATKPISKSVAKGKSAGKLGKPDDEPIDEPPTPPVVTKPTATKKPVPAQGSGEPSFDQLVHEAGVPDAGPAAPKLDRKSLSTDDVKRGLGALTAKARACFTGTEGVATVRLTVAPTGKVTKVTTTGPFAGTPTAACVERAVKSAAFPPWDGGPQSVGYSYLLSE